MASVTSTVLRELPARPPDRLTTEQYERMVDDGSLGESARVELINGYLVEKMGKNPPHNLSVYALIEALDLLLPPTLSWRKEDPIRIPDFDEPEPDIAVVRGRRKDFRHRIPDAATGEVLFVAEVSASTLDRDRGAKLRAYARGNIPVYWMLDVVRRQVEVYSDPSPSGYGQCQTFASDESIPLVIDGNELGRIPAANLFDVA